jgi:hypothetical protein
MHDALAGREVTGSVTLKPGEGVLLVRPAAPPAAPK